jgi:predicted nucleotidyltransferase
MKQQEVIQIIKNHQRELTDVYGVKSLALFGSVARNEAGSSSDVDILVEFSRPVGLFGLFALQDRLEELFGCKVDLGTPDSLKPRLRPSVMSELVYVS